VVIVDGMTSTRAIREYEQDNNIERCRIVALTGLASASARLEALNSGVDHFMTKPLNFRALGALLKREDERRNSVADLQESKDNEETEKDKECKSNKADKVGPDKELAMTQPTSENELKSSPQDATRIEKKGEADEEAKDSDHGR
jgi:DNA-binding response OmpR family regulator